MSDAESKKRSGEEEVEENGTKKRKTSGEVESVTEEPTLSPEAGVLIVGGSVHWDMTGRKELPKGRKPPPKEVNVSNLWGPHVWSEKKRVRAVATSCVACHSAIVTEDGKVYTWGRNDFGQLGVGDTETRFAPTLVEGLVEHNIVQAATGRSHTLFLTDKGDVYSCGNNKLGQLGQGTEGKDKLVPGQVDYGSTPIVKMACGADFSMIIDVAGGLHSFGAPEYGQLGHNSDGKMLEKAGKVTFICEKSPRQITKFIEKDKKGSTTITNVVIKDVKCGTNHAIALDTKGRVFTWGFGGYGRLGHSDTKDEMIPRQVKQLENLRCVITKIAAGSTFCLASATNKNLYFWGQTKSSGEATMYAKPIQDLSGWNINAMAGCNKSIAIAGDECLITWGPSPTYGELLYGESREKSSTIPKEVKPLDGFSIKDVAGGFGHILLIASDLTTEQRDRIAKLPKWP